MSPSTHHHVLFIFLLFAIPMEIFAQQDSAVFRFQGDLPYLTKKDQLSFNVSYSSTRQFRGKLSIAGFKLDNDTGIIVFRSSGKIKIKKGVHICRVMFILDDTSGYCNYKFLEVLKRAQSVAPGEYKINLSIAENEHEHVTSCNRKVDSVISLNSSSRKGINDALCEKKSASLFRKYVSVKSPAAITSFKKSKKKLSANIHKKGLRYEEYERGGKINIDLYFEDWFAGRYELNAHEPLEDQINRQESKAKNIGTSINTDMDKPSLISQFKEARKDRNSDEGFKGNIASTTYVSSDREPNSGMSNTYEEVRGGISVEILNVPVDFEGLYTTQDRNRKVKSSFIHAHYDNSKAKSELKNSIRSYNTKFEEGKSRALGLESMYNTTIRNLEVQKESLLKQVDTKGGVAVNTDDIESKKKRIEEIDSKIGKYKQIIEQSRENRYFDSSLVYSKTKGLNGDNLSYRQLQKRAKGMMPNDPKSKGIVSGLTSFDAGMFPKTSSHFTMNGQMIRGIDGGFDFGICEAGGTIGKTEYVGRDGSLDKYTCYAGVANVRPTEKQTIGIVYYGYSPDKLYTTKDAFFANRIRSISAPSFFDPVNIFATTYSCTAWDNVTIGGEVATSLYHSRSDSVQSGSRDRMAYHANAAGIIPKTPVSLQASFEKVGREFQNNTLPITLAGTERYSGGIRSDFFRSLFSAGVEYHYLIQRNYAVKGSNTRWGFDVKTNFKRYPNVLLSYKPFATFRSTADTFSIPQRPLFGEVWTGRVVYNIKSQGNFYRMSLLFNRNRTVMDTLVTGSELIQLSCGYTGKRGSLNMLAGQTKSHSPVNSDSLIATVNFLGAGGSYDFNKQWRVVSDHAWGFAQFGLCRYSSSVGCTVRPENLPVAISVNFRYNKMLRNATENWKEIYSGSLDVNYQFRKKRQKA